MCSQGSFEPGDSVAGDSVRDVLVALIGRTPAVLTETIWVLAHETPPVIPEEVVVLTTTVGREAILDELFRERGWARLHEALAAEGVHPNGKLRFGPAAACLRLFPSPDGRRNLADLTSVAEHEAAADFILESLRGFTEEPETRVIASLAGGRRTTSALLLSCMSLLARPGDRLCHVLAAPPYDDPALFPRFLFPEAGIIHRLPGRLEEYPSVESRLELIDVPFVRIRGLYEQRFRQLPPSYTALVHRVERWTSGADLPALEIDLSTGEVQVGGRRLLFSSFEFAFLAVVARRIIRGSPWRSWTEVGEELENLAHSVDAHSPPWLREFSTRQIDVVEDPRKLASTVRRKLADLTGSAEAGRRLLPDLKRKELPSYPVDRVRFSTSPDVGKGDDGAGVG